jgi:hypothetical protein
MFFARKKRHFKYDNLYDWFVGERVPERFVFLEDETERDKWITQYGELRQHLFERHLKTLSSEAQIRMREGRHPSQSHARVDEARPYIDLLTRHLADLGYPAHVRLIFHQMDRIRLSAALDHVPEKIEYGKLLPLYFEGFEVTYCYYGSEATSPESSRSRGTSECG